MDEQYIHHIVKYLNATISTAEHAELNDWLRQSEVHRRFLDETREIWLVSKLDEAEFVFDRQKAFQKFKEQIFSTQQFRGQFLLSYRWAAAAVFLLLFAAGGMLFYTFAPRRSMPQTLAFQEISAPYGARSTVKLPDGSTVTINAGTTLRYNVNFGALTRDLWLDGEAFFDVNKSATPFTVHSGHISIKALGTRFNVRAYLSEDEVQTTLVEGKLAINDHRKPTEEIVLLPNQKLTAAKKRIAPKQGLSGAGTETVETRNL